MKKLTGKRIASVLILASLIVPGMTLAQGANNGTLNRDAAAQRREELRAQAADRRQNATTTRLGDFRSRAENHMNLMIRRFNAAAERLETLSERIESRINKMEEAGLETGDAQELLETANEKIALAKAEIAKMPDLVKELLESDDRRAVFAELREIVSNTKTLLKEAHASLVRTITSLKPGLMRSDRSATSTN